MVGIILVSYRNSKEVIHYIKNQLSLLDCSYKVVIVDNSSDGNTLRELEQEFSVTAITKDKLKLSKDEKNKDIFLVDPKANLGFARGNNLGAEFIDINCNDVEYFLFSNTDIVINSPDTVSKLINKYNQLPNVGAIGPRVVGADGFAQSPHRYITFFHRYFVRLFLKYFCYKCFRKDMLYDIVEDAKEGFYYRLMGCFLLVKKEVFFLAGMFDSHTFLYAEEKIFSERLKRIGKYSYYYPETSVVHNESVTTSKVFTSFKKMRLIYKSDIYYYNKYKGISKIFLHFGFICVLFDAVVSKIRSVW